jgi:hypothetical protein
VSHPGLHHTIYSHTDAGAGVVGYMIHPDPDSFLKATVTVTQWERGVLSIVHPVCRTTMSEQSHVWKEEEYVSPNARRIFLSWNLPGLDWPWSRMSADDPLTTFRPANVRLLWNDDGFICLYYISNKEWKLPHSCLRLGAVFIKKSALAIIRTKKPSTCFFYLCFTRSYLRSTLTNLYSKRREPNPPPCRFSSTPLRSKSTPVAKNLLCSYSAPTDLAM